MIVEKTIQVKELPQVLRSGADPESFVLVSVRSLTDNGFTEEFEQGVLDAEKEAALSPSMPVDDFIAELKSHKP
jgi:hypothetical protein